MRKLIPWKTAAIGAAAIASLALAHELGQRRGYALGQKDMGVDWDHVWELGYEKGRVEEQDGIPIPDFMKTHNVVEDEDE